MWHGWVFLSRQIPHLLQHQQHLCIIIIGVGARGGVNINTVEPQLSEITINRQNNSDLITFNLILIDDIEFYTLKMYFSMKVKYFIPPVRLTEVRLYLYVNDEPITVATEKTTIISPFSSWSINWRSNWGHTREDDDTL